MWRRAHHSVAYLLSEQKPYRFSEVSRNSTLGFCEVTIQRFYSVNFRYSSDFIIDNIMLYSVQTGVITSYVFSHFFFQKHYYRFMTP